MNSFAIRLNQILKEKNSTMYKIAKDLNYSKTTISNWCMGKREPKVSDILRLAQYFDVSCDYLLGYTNADGSKNPDIINNFNNNRNNTVNISIKK